MMQTFFRAVGQMKTVLRANPVPIQIPIGQADEFVGLVDLVEMKAYYYRDEIGKDIEITDIPADMLEDAKKYRQNLIEAVAETDDALMEKFFEGEEFTIEEIKTGIRKATIALKNEPCSLWFKLQK